MGSSSLLFTVVRCGSCIWRKETDDSQRLLDRGGKGLFFDQLIPGLGSCHPSDALYLTLNVGTFKGVSLPISVVHPQIRSWSGSPNGPPRNMEGRGEWGGFRFPHGSESFQNHAILAVRIVLLPRAITLSHWNRFRLFLVFIDLVRPSNHGAQSWSLVLFEISFLSNVPLIMQHRGRDVGLTAHSVIANLRW